MSECLVIPMIGLELSHYSKATGTWDVVAPGEGTQVERLNALGVDGPNVWFGSGAPSVDTMKSLVTGKILDRETDWQAEGLNGLLWMTIHLGCALGMG